MDLKMCYSAMVRQNLDYLEQRFGALVVREAFCNHSELLVAGTKGDAATEGEKGRIFPNAFTTVVASKPQGRYVLPMRYQLWPPNQTNDPQRLSLYNARLDRLQTPFWRPLFMARHGLIVIDCFYEWVKVGDLLKAGQISDAEIRSLLERKTLERKEKIDRSGKRYRLTQAEKLPFEERKVIISFSPSADGQTLLVPVLWAERQVNSGVKLRSFAVITKDPPAEVAAAGHHRCPVILSDAEAAHFLNCFDCDAKAMFNLLETAAAPTLVHRLAS